MEALQVVPTEAMQNALHQTDISEEWQSIVLGVPWVLDGGLTLCKNKNTIYVLGVEPALLQADEMYNRVQLPVIVEAKAMRNILAYLNGVKSASVNTSVTTVKTNMDNVELTETIQKISQVNTQAIIKNVHRIGKWLSKDEKQAFYLFAVPII